MQPINRVAILGLGALGAFYASRFLDNTDCVVVAVADGDRKRAIEQDGFILNGVPYAIPTVAPDEPADPADLIIVALKHHHLPEAGDYLKHLVCPHTTILSVMNGLDSEAYLGKRYGAEKVLYTVSVGIDAVRAQNRVTYTNPGKLFVGEAVNAVPPSSRVRRVQAALARAQIACETPSDMRRVMWWKSKSKVCSRWPRKRSCRRTRSK